MVDNLDLYERLKQGPSLLFLGQESLSLETGVDPFLAEIIRKYGAGNNNTIGYYNILGNEGSKSIESTLAWMQEKCRHLSVPLWMQTVAEFAWSGIYTTAIDVIWQRAFVASWREIEPIFSEEKDPIDARSRSKLHCTYLFGAVDQASSDQRPPMTRMEMNKRRQVAIGLARRLPRLVTPFGTLIVEGYSSNTDWLPLDDFLAILDELSQGQIHWFHAGDELADHPDIRGLVENQKVVLYPQSLASFLKQGSDMLRMGSQPEEETLGHQIAVDGNRLTVPLPLWNQISRSAIVLDETIFMPEAELSVERRYTEFRNFLARSSERPIWSGYTRGFAFKRDFEDELHKEVSRSLDQKFLVDEPIILHGRSGIGKTVALGSLAHRIKQEKKHPVLFIERRPLRPSNVDVDSFVAWTEQNGASTTLIIWDGMLEYDQYLNFLQYLTGRGRKVVLVGSSYGQKVGEPKAIGKARKHKKAGNRLIEATAELNQGEIERFENHILQFVPNIGGIRSLVAQYGANFFVALYRLLPATRNQLSVAINLEAVYSEERIRRLAESMRETVDSTTFNSPLAFALAKAGFVSSESVFSSEREEIGGELFDQVQRLIGLIMVPGRFGLSVPIDLAIRTLHNNSNINFINILNQIELFSWNTDSIGNITIGPRHALEAELVARRRLGGPKYEIDFVAELVRSIGVNEVEIQFAVDLIRKVNPPDEEAATNLYAPFLVHVADALAYLREQRSVLNPRLMLQETNLLRETAKMSLDATSEQYQILLDRAETVVNSALTLVDQDHLNSGLRSQLLVELAATLGAQAKQLYTENPQNALRLYNHLRQYLFDARSVSRDNFHPIDVLFWTTKDLIKAEHVDATVKLEAQAEIQNIFEMAQLEESFTSQTRFQERRQELGQLLRNQKMTNEAFYELERQGSTAGYVLRAMHIAGVIPQDSTLDSITLRQISDAASFLMNNRGIIAKDGRAMQVLLRYWWLSKTQHPIFWSERQTVPFSRDDWNYCYDILSDVLNADEIYRAPIINYLVGVALFHLDSFESATRYFNELERDSTVRGRRRIIRSYLMSTPQGQPRKFAGSVDWLSVRDNRGMIYVPEIRRNILFLPEDFRRSDLVKGSSISEFHIAFNFLGYLADPPRFYSEKQVKS